ncbi:hypothetical protein [Inhella gelatinilytica]|uniref:Uncharacterized protein n=1 Tax=Inhella gelatinilytica TaxID=2795030 RepID=A0A931IU17_9BURK|nr:hypothetical protein [Inhella gelatinilytica]MBH9551952.1 hypothetical protein [Inhella gelatinilytica]
MHKPHALRRLNTLDRQSDLHFEDPGVQAVHESLSTPAVAPGIPGSERDPLGWQLGYDHARCHVPLPAAHLHPASPLFQGFHAALQAGLSSQQRDVAAGTRVWLSLRLQAWTEGLPYEEQLLTPHYLRQLRRTTCPVTRQSLHDEQGHPQQRTWARLRQDHGYAAGHLVQLSRTAAQALKNRTATDLQHVADHLAPECATVEGLDAASWARLAALARMVQAHDDNPDPLPVLPPNRLRLLNPHHALQAWITRQLALPGWAARGNVLAQALPTETARTAAQGLVAALAPHALRLPQHEGKELQWLLEDLWRDPRVQRRWVGLRVATRGVDLETLLLRLPAPTGCHLEHHAEAGATEGWTELH